VVLGLCPGVVAADVLHHDSFASCNGSGWQYDVGGSSSFPATDCQDGACCGKKNVSQGACDASLFWSKDVNYSGTDLYIMGWWKFPTDWRFAGNGGDPCGQSGDFKAITVETADGHNRLFVNFRTAGPSPSTAAHIAFISEQTGEAWELGSGAQIHADGAWHSVELYVRRVPNGGAVKVWFDGALFVDNPDYAICGPNCSSVREVKMGGYQNWAAPANQSFFLDNATIATTRIGEGGNGGGSGGGSNSGGGSGGSGVVTADECDAPDPARIFCDGFEAGDLNYWNDDLNTQGDRLHVQTAGPFAGTTFARMSHAAGTSDAWGVRFFADHPELSTPGNMTGDLYVRLRTRFSSTSALQSDSAKIAITAAFAGWQAGFPGPNSWSPYYATLFVTEAGLFSMETHSKTSGASVWRQFPQNLGAPQGVQPGTWHELQYRLKLNTPGSADGVLEYWVDGVKKAEYTDVNYRGSYNLFGWNHMMLSAHQDPVAQPHDQDWDVVVGSTTLIQSVTANNTIPAPTGVVRTDTID
jgi:hypothetical protein